MVNCLLSWKITSIMPRSEGKIEYTVVSMESLLAA